MLFRSYSPVLGIKASIFRADRDIALTRLSERVEAELRELSTRIALYYAAGMSAHVDSLASTRKIASVQWQHGQRDSTSLGTQQELPPSLLCDADVATLTRASDEGHIWPYNTNCTCFSPSQSYNNQLICPQAQYKLDIALPIPIHGQEPPDKHQVDNGLMSTRLSPRTATFKVLADIGDTLRRHISYFPYEPGQTPGKTTSDFWSFDKVDRAKPPITAFLYCALAVQEPGIVSERDASMYSRLLTMSLAQAKNLDPYGAKLAGTSRLLECPNDTWHKRVYVYLGYPASPLPAWFHVALRPWFFNGMRSPHVQWSAAYGDIGTELPVITASTQILDAQGQPIGVLAADLRISSLAYFDLGGTPLLINLLFAFLAAFSMYAIVYASGMWRHLRPLYYVFVCVYAMYVVMALQWLIEPQPTIYRDALTSIGTMLSIFNSALLLLSTRNLDIIEGRTSADSRVLRNAERFLGRHRESSHVFAMAAAALIVWCMTFVVEEVVRSAKSSGTLELSLWVDSALSFACLVIFGVTYARWVTGNTVMAKICRVLIAGVFVVYGSIQLFYPLYESKLLWWLFGGKLVVFSVIMGGVFLYSQNYNYIRRQLAIVVRKVYSRPLADAFVVVIAKATEAGCRVLAVNNGACRALSLFEGASGGGEDGRRRRSILGDEGFHEPTEDMDVQELFMPGEYERLTWRLNAEPGDGNGVKTLKGVKARMQRSRHAAGGARSTAIEPVEVVFHAISWWQDRHLGGEGRSGQKYFVAIGRAWAEEDKKERSDKGPLIHGHEGKSAGSQAS